MPIKNIAISGEIGTGTTTLSKNLAAKLGWDHLNAGDHIRAWYKENNIPLEEALKIDEQVDRKLDASFQNRMSTDEKVVFESRLAGWLARDYPGTFKVLCICDPEVAMERVVNRDNISKAEAVQKTGKRAQELREKFERLYGASDYLNKKYFDLVIDTTHLNQDQVLEQVLKLLPI
jgi:cytidylate kinase